MFYRTVQYEITDDGFILVSFEPSEYAGPVELCKKGDKEKKVGAKQEALAGTETTLGNKDQGIQDTYRATADPFEKSLISTTPGQMSPYAAAQYGSDVENIANTYQNLRQAGFRALGARGFGNAPAGFQSSMENNLLDQQGKALTTAYRGGLDRTLGEGMQAADYFQRGQSIYNPMPAYSGANSSYTGATGSYKAGDDAASNAWKTGIGAATGLASAFIPGGQLAGGFAKLLNYGQPKPTGLGPTFGSENPSGPPGSAI